MGDFKSHKEKLLALGDQYESRSFFYLSHGAVRLLDGFFHFKKRKGEIVAGSVTLFVLMSFSPLLLLMCSLIGMILGDTEQARDYVMGFIMENFPQLAGWIVKSLANIVDSQLTGAGGFNIVNTLILIYACMGIVGSLIFGINQIAKSETKGGFLFEDFKSIVTGLCVSGFMMALLVISHKGIMYGALSNGNAHWNSAVKFVVDYNVFPVIASMGFFTMFYQWATPIEMKWKDSFFGACAFVGCFILGKSFYWVYLLYAKDSLTQSYGNFYTIFIAVFWVYFLTCAFFYGASVAYVCYKEIYRTNKRPVTDHPTNSMPFKNPFSKSDDESDKKSA